MNQKILLLFVLLFSHSAFSADPNMDSYKNAGECSEMTRDKNCVYCSLKKKFISLGTNSKDQTPKDEDYEFVDPNGNPKKGNR